MSHGIYENDKGAVYGTTWHGIPSYRTFDRPITVDEAIDILDYDLEKRQLVVDRGNGEYVPTGVYEVFRTDTEDVLVPSVSETYNLINNARIFERVDEQILSPNPDIKIESVGTLFNGQTSFVNLLLGKFEVKGDNSETLNRLMYYNPLGRGSYKSCAHTIRVVCNNTARAASAQGEANKTLRKVAHTRNADIRLEGAIEDILGLRKGFQDYQDQMNDLTNKTFDADFVTAIVKKRCFYDDKPSDKRVAAFVGRLEEKMDETKEEYSVKIRKSRYTLFQAFTDVLDAPGKKSKSDAAYRQWDGMVGIRSNVKSKVLADLVKVG